MFGVRLRHNHAVFGGIVESKHAGCSSIESMRVYKWVGLIACTRVLTGITGYFNRGVSGHALVLDIFPLVECRVIVVHTDSLLQMNHCTVLYGSGNGR